MTTPRIDTHQHFWTYKQLEAAPSFVDRHPDQAFILDHCAKPCIREGVIEPWRAHLRELARRPDVYCKLLGLTTEADHDLRPRSNRERIGRPAPPTRSGSGPAARRTSSMTDCDSGPNRRPNWRNSSSAFPFGSTARSSEDACSGWERTYLKSTSTNAATLLARCNAHSRRKFIEVESSFPDEARHVLETIAQVYRNDAATKKQNLSANERLSFHQEHSRPLLDELAQWFKELLERRKIEPNGSLGGAIAYMTKHWDALTLFLRVPGAPLDNNLCERVLKRAILHRKTALFYKTLNGARVGDLFMSIIHPAELAKIDVFGYLVALQRHHERVEEDPAAWMPWNYSGALAQLTASAPPT